MKQGPGSEQQFYNDRRTRREGGGGAARPPPPRPRSFQVAIFRFLYFCMYLFKAFETTIYLYMFKYCNSPIPCHLGWHENNIYCHLYCHIGQQKYRAFQLIFGQEASFSDHIFLDAYSFTVTIKYRRQHGITKAAIIIYNNTLCKITFFLGGGRWGGCENRFINKTPSTTLNYKRRRYILD